MHSSIALVLAAVITPLLVGCAAPETPAAVCAESPGLGWNDGGPQRRGLPVVVHLGPGVDPALLSTAVRSAREAGAVWEAAVPGVHLPAGIAENSALWDGTVHVVLCSDDSPALVGQIRAPYGAAGVARADSRRPTVAVRVSSAGEPAIFAHELGHVLGAEHVDDPNALMTGSVIEPGRSPTPTATDIAALP